VWGEGESGNKKTRDSRGRSVMFQMLEDRTLQVEVPSY